MPLVISVNSIGGGVICFFSFEFTITVLDKFKLVSYDDNFMPFIVTRMIKKIHD